MRYCKTHFSALKWIQLLHENLLLTEEYQLPDTNCEGVDNAIEVQDATFMWESADPPDQKASKDKIKGRYGIM